MKTGFGWVNVQGTTYEHDVVIHTDGSVTKRKKKASKALKGEYGHTPLSELELGFVTGEDPEVVYIGTGQYGDLPVTPEAQSFLSRYSPVMKPTPSLLDRIEKENRRFIAILHVTC
ncbi:MAG TPA: hypothetical protein VMC84_05460 [Methanocella sp.]|uniref:hypothetical protein n=1 Tax=Methanocella sp. TaxID=2052833 RepID=UPI002CFD045E|nr:hypothetical protein [Methanocella sp.]HTY90606.1 hypothetical protein [Methanocella sp.]